MKPLARSVAVGLAVLFLGGAVLSSGPAWGAFMYKKYAVKYDRGHDILCEPYVVKKNDWVLKVFKRKGEIAYSDFREFLIIFQRINPHIKNVNQLRPGQYVLIPLRRIPLDSLPGQSTGTVTIPFVTLSKLPSSPPGQSITHTVSKGDTVSALISGHFGAFGTAVYMRGIELFRELNPDVNDLNLIYTGQKLVLPSREFEGLTQAPERSEQPTSFRDNAMPESIPPLDPALREWQTTLDNPMARAASILGAKLLDSGVYYFPNVDATDLKIDLSKYPVMVFKGGTRILFRGDNILAIEATKPAALFWKNLKYADISPRDTTDRIVSSIMDVLGIKPDLKELQFEDHGISVKVKGKWIIDAFPEEKHEMQRSCITLIDNAQEQTPRSIVRYLEQHGILLREVVRGKWDRDHFADDSAFLMAKDNPITLSTENSRIFVKRLMEVIGYRYTENVAITFPYAGIQVKAISNLISTPNGTPVFVDFGDLYGDAVDAILKTGFSIVQLRPEDDAADAVPRLLDAAGATFVINPTLRAAKRESAYNTTLTLPGYMVEKFGRPTMLLTKIALPRELLHFLMENEIMAVKIGAMSL